MFSKFVIKNPTQIKNNTFSLKKATRYLWPQFEKYCASYKYIYKDVNDFSEQLIFSLWNTIAAVNFATRKKFSMPSLSTRKMNWAALPYIPLENSNGTRVVKKAKRNHLTFLFIARWAYQSFLLPGWCASVWTPWRWGRWPGCRRPRTTSACAAGRASCRRRPSPRRPHCTVNRDGRFSEAVEEQCDANQNANQRCNNRGEWDIVCKWRSRWDISIKLDETLFCTALLPLPSSMIFEEWQFYFPIICTRISDFILRSSQADYWDYWEDMYV